MDWMAGYVWFLCPRESKSLDEVCRVLRFPGSASLWFRTMSCACKCGPSRHCPCAQRPTTAHCWNQEGVPVGIGPHNQVVTCVTGRQGLRVQTYGRMILLFPGFICRSWESVMLLEGFNIDYTVFPSILVHRETRVRNS